MPQSIDRTHKRLFLMGILLGTIWPLYRLIFSEGWILDDELSHYMLSRAVWHWPEILLDEWARPGRNLIHSLAAPFGLTVSRLFTLLLSTASVYLCYKIALHLKIRYTWSIPIMLCFQPWYPELSYPVLTQAPFLFVWILAIYLALLHRDKSAAFAFGYLSLIRHEGIFLTALWGAWVCCRNGGWLHAWITSSKSENSTKYVLKKLLHDLTLGWFTVLPIILLNLIAFSLQGRIPFLIYFDTTPTDIYGQGTLFHYLPLVYSSVGKIVLLLSLAGLLLLLFKRRQAHSGWSLLLLTYPAYFLLHVVIFWKGSFASGGYYHFLMPMAPMFALLGSLGFQHWYDTISSFKISTLLQRLAIAMPLSIIVYTGMHMPHYQHQNQDWKSIMEGKANYQTQLLAPVDRQPNTASNIAAAYELARTSNPLSRIHCADVYFYYLTDSPDTAEFRRERLAPLSTYPIHSYYIWESKYADLETRTSRKEFLKNPNWIEVKRWSRTGEEKPSVILFKKDNSLPYSENMTPKGKNLSY